MDDAARTETLTHELGHVLLHDPLVLRGTIHPARGLKEVEAESVGFIVADAYGMATDDYTFPYITAWAAQDGTKAVRATASRVASAAKSVIEASTAPHGTGGRPPVVEAALTDATRAGAGKDASTELGALEERGIGGAA